MRLLAKIKKSYFFDLLYILGTKQNTFKGACELQESQR